MALGPFHSKGIWSLLMTSVRLTESTDPRRIAPQGGLLGSHRCTWPVPPWVFGADDGRCSATLIAPRVALSSSYCFADTARVQIKQLRTGEKFAGRVVALVGGPAAAILPSLILLDTPVPPPVDLPTKRTIRRAQAKHTVPIPAYRLEAQMLKEPPSAEAFGTRLNAYSADTRLPAQGGCGSTPRLPIREADAHAGARSVSSRPDAWQGRRRDPVRAERLQPPRTAARTLRWGVPIIHDDGRPGHRHRGCRTGSQCRDAPPFGAELSGLDGQPLPEYGPGRGLLAQQRSGKDFLVGLVQGFAVHTRMSAYWPAVYKTLRENNMDADALVIARQVLGQRRDDSRRVDPGEVRMRVVADGGPPLFFRRIAPARAGYRELPVDGRDDEGWEFLGTDLPDRQTAERQVNIWNSADLAPPLVGAVYAQFNGRLGWWSTSGEERSIGRSLWTFCRWMAWGTTTGATSARTCPRRACRLNRQRSSLLLQEALPDLDHLGQHRHEQLHQCRVEVPARLRAQVFHRLLDRPGRLVGTNAGQRVEDVGDRDDAGLDGNRVARQSFRIAAAVPLLVVRQRDAPRHAQQTAGVLAQDLRADRGMAAHHRPLGLVQRAGLLQDRVGNAQLADVVHGRGVQQVRPPPAPTSPPPAPAAASSGSSAHVPAGLVVLVLGRAAQPLHDLQPRLAQLLGAHQRQMRAHPRPAPPAG
ncbi:hypothetical protein Ddc_24113 [Ditylenchus destructor]|nr:hypothetical protein Ddc_24113 [Ditylenchus destructor]